MNDRSSMPFAFDRRKFVVRRRSELPSVEASIERAVRDVLSVAKRCGLRSSRDVEDLEIVIREAVANAVIHGNERSRQKSIQLRCYGTPANGARGRGAALVVAVADEGSGFDPEDIPDPRDDERRLLSHGRGLLIMRELVDRLEYRKGGREVVLYKRFPKP